jgi:hypothetical protein
LEIRGNRWPEQYAQPDKPKQPDKDNKKQQQAKKESAEARINATQYDNDHHAGAFIGNPSQKDPGGGNRQEIGGGIAQRQKQKEKQPERGYFRTSGNG